MTRKSIITLGTVIVLVVAGVFTVAAQNGTTTPPCPGIMQGRWGSMMGGGFGYGMMMDANQDTMMAAAAKTLGLEQATLIDKLHNGQTWAQIAEAQGVKVQDVYDVMLAQAKEHMSGCVAAGTLTQAQADQYLTWMRDNIADMPGFAGGAGAGGCMGYYASGNYGMMGMMGRGHGMMGRGHGMMGNNS